MKIIYHIIYALWYVLSLLPLKLLYFISDILYLLVYYIIRYRRKTVKENLIGSFPDKKRDDIVKIEKEFYHFFCDYIVETIKLLSISKQNLKKRMIFEGVDEIVKKMSSEDKNFCFVYLGHYCNWEWIASLPYWVPNDVLCGQIYHPLKNKAFDELFLNLRNHFGGECISMKETLRKIVELKRSRQKTIIGFISDQSPKWNSIHHWTTFFNRETPVFTGTEKIGKQVGALIYYADVKRIKRGYYQCTFKYVTNDPKSIPDFEMTDFYTKTLQKMISEAPAFWLWSHKRWKRKKEDLKNQNKERICY